MEERLNMPVYDTKVLLQSIAEIAVRDGAKSVYKAIARMAHVEGFSIPSYEEALADLKADQTSKE